MTCNIDIGDTPDGDSKAGTTHKPSTTIRLAHTDVSTIYSPSEALESLLSGPLSTDVMNWCKTFDKPTLETVLEAIPFGRQPPPPDKTPPSPGAMVVHQVRTLTSDLPDVEIDEMSDC